MDQAKQKFEEYVSNEAISIGTGSWPPPPPLHDWFPYLLLSRVAPFAASGAQGTFRSATSSRTQTP